MKKMDKIYEKFNGSYFAFLGAGISLGSILIAIILYVAVDTIYYGYPIRIAEYDPVINNFKRIFQYFPFHFVKDFAVGDHDQDGLMDFAVGDMMNRFYVFEHTGVDNGYSLVYQDTITLPNAF